MWRWVAATVQTVGDALRVPRPITLELEPLLTTFDTAPRPVDRVLAAMRDGSGSVTRAQALQIAAVLRGRNELCSISTLPLRMYQGLNVQDSPLFRQFDPDVPNVVHMSMTIEDLVFDQVAWWQVTAQDFERYPMAVKRISPDRVRLDPPKGQRVPDGERPDRYVWIDLQDGRGWRMWPAALMIRFDSPNPGLLSAQKVALRIARQLDNLTGMYADNPALREFFTDADDIDADPMTDPEIDQFLADYGAMRQTRPYGWIPSNVKRSDVSSPSPKDLTLVELRESVNLAIANALGVDPEDLGVSTTSRTYFNSVDKKQDKINRTYAPFMKAITDRLSMGDVTKRGYTAQFDLTDYLKSSPAEQAAYWAQLKGMGVTDADEIRGWAGLSGPAPKTTAPAAAPEPVDSSARTRLRLASAEPAFMFNATDFADPPAAPTVDTAARTITGLAVPYGAVANKFGLKYEFAPGSLEYSEPARMAHLKDHTTPVGFHRKITDSAAGPIVELAVLDAPEGSPAKFERDQLLYDAEHGLYSGLSVGVDFSLDPEDGDVEITDEGVYRVVRATWRETSTTFMPAFDDARVTRVAASRSGGNPVHCTHCGKPHAPNMACATFAALNPSAPTPTPAPAPVPDPAPAPAPVPGQPDPAMVAAFAAFMQSQNAPVPVNPHHGPAQVTEPAPYVFDSKGWLRDGAHSFAGDLVAAAKRGDQAAKDRISGFIRTTFADPEERARQVALAAADTAQGVTQHGFAVTPANVAGLNPNRQRPDLYVDQMEYNYPLWAAVEKGTLTDITPFTLPKYSSSSGLVADHVSGTEPTPGAFAVTTQTITPTPVSGKLEVLREALDQIGNPQMTGLLWRQMVRAYYEALEAYAQAQFVANAASIPDITITTAAVDSALDQALKAALVPLQYIRGGNRFRRVFAQIDLYKAMVAAKDSTGRALYPVVGPQNASGTVEDGYAAINAHGMLWIPTWATAASGTVAASSWMFDPDKVYGAASAPERIDIEWRVAWVDIGIWGYKAMGFLDFAGTREVSYDPV
jgi:portal protein